MTRANQQLPSPAQLFNHSYVTRWRWSSYKLLDMKNMTSTLMPFQRLIQEYPNIKQKVCAVNLSTNYMFVKVFGQTFCDLPTCLHLFYCIFYAIRIKKGNFFQQIVSFQAYFELPFLARISPSDMNDFSWFDLPTFYYHPM